MKRLNVILTYLLILFVCITPVQAHSGRTDGSGGHRDNKNASGLGYYHYHHGMGPHLHPGGVCPYSAGYSKSNSNSTSSSSNSSRINTKTATISGFPIKINNAPVSNALDKYPILTYKNITYLPLTNELCTTLGININWNETSGLALSKGNKPANFSFYPEQDYSNNSYSGKTIEAKLPEFNITVNGASFINSEQENPFLEYRDITYMPLTWNNVFAQFGMAMTWDATNGLSIWR